MATLVTRWSQAAIPEASWTPDEPWAPARLQLFVDDPAAVAWGERLQRKTTFALLVLFWLVLGLPLSWKKGAVYQGVDMHQWIGVRFTIIGRGIARMTLPPGFITEFLDLCRAFLSTKLLSVAQANALTGKAGRVADILPLTRPFVASLYAALSASLAAAAAGLREAPPGMVACKRFWGGAQWMLRILSYRDRRAPVPHSQDIFAPSAFDDALPTLRIEVDASPWGGGGVLFEDGLPTRCFSVEWLPDDFTGTSVQVGQPASQTFFEVLALVLATELWCVLPEPCVIYGDNVAALQAAVALKGKGDQLRLIQALAVIRSARTLSLSVAHPPSESNDAADCLSHQFGPAEDCKPWPFEQDSGILIDTPLRPSSLLALAT